MVQSIFSTYSQGENRVTSSIIQVLRHLPINVVEHFLRMFTETDTREFFSFKNQVAGTGSVPDAEIEASFSLLFEIKLNANHIGEVQLKNHVELAESRSSMLVYLTPDVNKPKILADNSVVWKSFQNVYDLISELLEEPTLILSERDQFLLRNLQDLFSESGLLPKIDEVVVVAASTAWPAYQKFGVYVCQAERSFRDVELIAFYADGSVQDRVATIRARKDNFEFSENSLAKETEINKKLRRWLMENPWAKEERKSLQVFDLSEADHSETKKLKKVIPNDLQNEKGRGYAFTQGQRYVLLSQLIKATTTSDL